MIASEYLKRARVLSWAQLAERVRWRLLRTGRRVIFYRRLHRKDSYPVYKMIRSGSPWYQTAEDIQRWFRDRSTPRFFFDETDRDFISSQAQTLDPAGVVAVIEEAERILENRIYVHGFGEVDFGERIKWSGGSHVFRDNLLSRHDFIPTLVQAYWYTSDCRFAERAVSIWRDWLNQAGRLRTGESIDDAFRILNWLWMVYGLRTEHFFKPVDFVWLLTEIYRFGFHIETEMLFAGNHRIIEGLGLWCIGVFFPDLKRAWRWRLKGESILLEEIERQVFPDGVHMEMSSGYHVFVTTHFLKFYLLSLVNDYPVPDSFHYRLVKMLAFVAAIRKPDGEMPMLGDSDSHRTRDREHRESALLSPALSLLAGGENTLGVLSRETELAPWYFGHVIKKRSIETGGDTKSGASNDLMSSRLFPDVGYVLMRTGCNSTKHHYLLMDAGPFGFGALGHHGHADALHVEICTSGESLVIDAGGYGYFADAWRQFFRSTRAHSTVVVDGQNQSEIYGIFGVGRTAQCRITTWFTNERIDFAVAYHDGYCLLTSPVIHRRSVLFVKEPPVYWIILDSLEGRGEHTLDLLFHLIPETRLRKGEAGEVIILQPQGTFTSIRSLLSPPDIPAVIIGQQDPELQGWIARTISMREPAPVLSFVKHTSLPHRFATLIRPEICANSSFKVPQPLSSSQCTQSQSTWELHWPYTHDRVCLVQGSASSPYNSQPTASIERWMGDRLIWREQTASA